MKRKTPEWSYAGDTGPEYWGRLGLDCELCEAGQRQSPIEIKHADRAHHITLEIHYQPSAIHLLNTGRTLQVNLDPGSHIVFDGIRYDLVQFHFHLPAEHRINEHIAAMELHLVHQSADGVLAVIGVMIEPGDMANDALAPVWNNAPTTMIEEAETVEGATINPADLLPACYDIYTYNGSLTMPPCTEGVRWLVLTSPIYLSQQQIDVFATTLFAGNSRPIQPLNGRMVKLISSIKSPQVETQRL